MNNEHKPLSVEILARIREERIEPLPRWRFFLPRAVFWGITALSIALGSTIVVTVLSILLDLNGDLPGELPIRVFISAGFATVPLLWLVLILVLVIIATLVIRTTGRGYRFPIGKILVANVAGTLALGGALYALGDRPPIERFLGPASFMGPSVHERHMAFWANPEEGRIIGRVVSLSGGTMLLRTSERETRTLVFPSGGWPLPEFVATGSIVRAVGAWDGAVFRVQAFLPDRPLPRGFENGDAQFFQRKFPNDGNAGKGASERPSRRSPEEENEFFERINLPGTYGNADRPILE